MTFPQILLLVIVVVPLMLVVRGIMRTDIAALVIAAALAVAQYVGIGIIGPANTPGDSARAVSGFSQPVVITLIGLFIVTRALDKTGITRWLVQRLLAIGGTSESRLLTLFAGTSAFLSLVMNNVAAGALLLPGAMEASRLTGVRPSKLLIPVAYGSMLGGAATYFTTANIIVSDLLPIANPPQEPLGILDFTPTGGLLVLAGLLFFWLFGKRVLPDRVPPAEQMLTRPTGSQLEDRYELGERLWEVRVPASSTLGWKSLAQAELGQKFGITVAAVLHDQQTFFSPSPEMVIRPGDVLLVVGREERVNQLRDYGVTVGRESKGRHISPRGVMLEEVMPGPFSRAIGKTLKELNFRKLYGVTAVALWRKNRSYRTNVADFSLEVGDSLLVVGTQPQMQRLAKDPDFIVLEPSLSDQPVDRRNGLISVLVILGSIALSVLGMPVYLAMLLGALVLLLTGVMRTEEAYRAIEWQVIFLVAGMYSVSLAMVATGLAELVGDWVLRIVRPIGPLGLAAGAYLISSLLTQVMGGQVTALVTGPIVISAAIAMGANPQAVAVACAIGCSASFLTPLSHPVNVLMIAPANYRFSDFFHIGWRLTLICFVMLLVGMKLFWGL